MKMIMQPERSGIFFGGGCKDDGKFNEHTTLTEWREKKKHDHLNS